MKRKTLGGLLAMTVAGSGFAAPSYACVMSSPPSEPGNEIEIEIEQEDYDSSQDRIRYKIEVEVEAFSPTSTVQCQCALGLGSSTEEAPSSFDVVSAIVGIRGGSEVDLIPFSGFTRDASVESDFSNLQGFPAGATPYGFSLDVSPFSVPPLASNDILVLAFEIEFDPDDFDQVNGQSIQFAAGSNEPGHALNIFSGYQATLNLFAPVIPEPASAMLFGGLGLVELAKRRRGE